MVLLTINFVSIKDDVGDAASYGYSYKSPLTVNRVRHISVFSGRQSYTKFPYVAFLPTGTSYLCMKSIVSIPSTRFLIPLASRPHSFDNDLVQVAAISPVNKVAMVSRLPVMLLKT